MTTGNHTFLSVWPLDEAATITPSLYAEARDDQQRMADLAGVRLLAPARFELIPPGQWSGLFAGAADRHLLVARAPARRTTAGRGT